MRIDPFPKLDLLSLGWSGVCAVALFGFMRGIFHRSHGADCLRFFVSLSPFLEAPNISEQIQRMVLPACQIFYQAHNKAVFAAGIDDDRRDFRLAKNLEWLQSPLAADQFVYRFVSVFSLTRSNRNRSFQPKLRNVRSDLIEHLFVPEPW